MVPAVPGGGSVEQLGVLLQYFHKLQELLSGHISQLPNVCEPPAAAWRHEFVWLWRNKAFVWFELNSSMICNVEV